jgi:HSP20 family molecular chaperone IbpA
MSNTAITRKRSTPSPKIDALSFRMSQDPMFVQAVNRAANVKCLAAIKAGRLRVVPGFDPRGAVRYSPRMDLINDPSSSKVLGIFELPGIKSSDISLQLREGHLIVCGRRTRPTLETLRRELAAERHSMKAEEQEVTLPVNGAISQEQTLYGQVPIQELRYGAFHRAIRIPDGIRESDISATLHEGMLKVTWPKSAAVQQQSVSSMSTTSPMPSAPSPPPHTHTSVTVQ